MKVICDKCKTQFEVKNLNKRWLSNGIQEIFYSCENCGEDYRVCITNKKIRDMQTKIKQLKVKIEKKRNKGDNIASEVSKLEKLMKKHKKEMDMLNQHS